MPSTEQRNALPDTRIDRLFMRFSVLYGKHWADMWAGIPIDQVKAAWAHELARFSNEQLGAGLKAVGKFPPTLPEFVALCKPQSVPPAHRFLLPDRSPREPIPQHIRDVLRKVRERAQE